MRIPHRKVLLSLTTVATCVLAACGGGGNSGFFSAAPAGPSSTSSNSTIGGGSTPATFSGVVAASGYVPGSTTGNPTLKAGYYQNAKVFLDANGNGVLDSGEASAVTDGAGKFTLTARGTGTLVADIGTNATNTASGARVASHLILRASADQIADQGADHVVISPLSSEAQRLVEANKSSYAVEKANLATRLNGPAFNLGTAAVTDPLADVNTLGDASRYAVLYEDNQLTNRYTYATAKLDRGDMYPDHLAVAGGDPRLVGMAGVSPATAVPPTQQQAKITFAQAQQAAFNIEGVPAFDNIFVIVEENKSSGAILGNTRVPYMNALLKGYNQLTTYYSTGNPSEPNYTALGGGDDYGITDDNWWGCGAVVGGPYAIQDQARDATVASDGQPLPATYILPTAGGTASGGQSSSLLAGFSTTPTAVCGAAPTTAGTVHNIPGANLFTLLSKAGMTARTYSESMNPGQDARADSVAEAGITATYRGSYVADDLLTQAAIDANPSLASGVLTGTTDYPVAAGLYKVKHGPAIAWQDARNLPEFYADNRTIFGTQYQETDWKKSNAYAGYDKSAWIYDQFSKDLATGDVGNINFIVPDQCDDMHGVGSDASCANNNNGAAAGLTRADIYLQKMVSRIRDSALWKNPQKRVAIVVVFDEGEGSSTSCCGWNPSQTSAAQPLTIDANGTITTTSPTNYKSGNHGHGQTIFGVATNQHDLGKQNKGVVDSDAYSHFSLVRTLQDMFQLADPANDASYLNRARYTEAFIAQNILNLPELASSADTHFDAVRPINHAFMIPASYTQRLNPADYAYAAGTSAPTYQTGPDITQESIWGPAR